MLYGFNFGGQRTPCIVLEVSFFKRGGSVVRVLGTVFICPGRGLSSGYFRSGSFVQSYHCNHIGLALMGAVDVIFSLFKMRWNMYI